MLNLISHSFALLTREISSGTREEKLDLCTQPCITLFSKLSSSSLSKTELFCFLPSLKRMHDKAHLVEEWGFDFRPDFANLS